MFVRNKVVFFLFVAIAALMMTGCGGNATEAVPTVDPNMIYTEAAQAVAMTVAAQLTAAPPTQAPAEPAVAPTEVPAAAAQPTIAPLQPTIPGQVVQPTVATGGMAVNPTVPPLVATTPAMVAQPIVQTPIVPTAVPTQKVKIEDQAAFTYQWPPDWATFNAGASFDGVFTFQNIGDTTWNSFYTIRRYQGHNLGKEEAKWSFAEYADNQTVEKGEYVTITIPGLQAPFGSGKYSSFYRLCTGGEDVTPVCFYLVNINITVP